MIYFVGCVPRVDPQCLPGSSSLPCDLHYRSRRPRSRRLSESGFARLPSYRDRRMHGAAAARRLACKHQTRAQASAGSGEIGGQPTITLSEGAQSAVGRRMLVPCLTAYWRTRILLPSTKTSILVRKKQSSASAGLQTMGSFSLKEVLRTIGTSVSWRNASISA